MKRTNLFRQATILAMGLSALGARAMGAPDNSAQRGNNRFTQAIDHVGVNLGMPRHQAPCHGGFECKNASFAGKIYTGTQISSGIGLELGYVNTGSAKRNGGMLRAQGINLNLVGDWPITPKTHGILKLGGIYGWSSTSAAPQSPAGGQTGKSRGFAPTFGVGLAFDVDMHNQLRLEWDKQYFRYASGKHGIDFYSLGWRYKF